jgi:hypothetical protein
MQAETSFRALRGESSSIISKTGDWKLREDYLANPLEHWSRKPTKSHQRYSLNAQITGMSCEERPGRET